MDVTGAVFSFHWRWVALALYLPALGWAISTAPWERLVASEPVHVWYGGILALVLLWSIDAALGSGISFHLLGVSLFALMVGPRLAFVAGAAVVAIVIATRSGMWVNLPLATLIMTGIPVAVTSAILRVAERRLAANFFVYIFVVGFFGSWIALIAEGVVAAAALITGAGQRAGTVIDEYLAYTALLGVGEATMTGMLLTLLVVYRPRWVATFDDRRYLSGK